MKYEDTVSPVKYEYLVEWDYYTWGGYRLSQKYTSLEWAKRRFEEKVAYNPTISRRLISPWEVMEDHSQ